MKPDYAGRRIGYPTLGVGLVGGDGPVIAAIIDEELTAEAHVFVQWTR